MADYIKRDTAYNYLTEFYNHRTDIQHQNLRKALNAIPSEDVVEIPKTGIGDLSDGYHTFNGLYYQRMVLFNALVNAYNGRAWKSWKHEDGEPCFGGGWFIVGIDTPKGSYTYHYEDKYWNWFECKELPVAKHWDGHTEEDVTRLFSLPDVQPVVRCKDCKHRPIVEGDYISEPGEIYSDYTCPYLCDDCWYNRMPEDSWYCNHGERKDGGT